MNMASGRTKLAEYRQKEFDALNEKIRDSNEEFSKPFPQQEGNENLFLPNLQICSMKFQSTNL